MKKFEEELNNGLVSIGQNIITKEYAYSKGALINYFKDWVSLEDHQAEIEKLKSQLEKQQPEIPEFMANYIEAAKEDFWTLLSAMDDSNLSSRVGDWLKGGNFRNQEIFAQAWLNGYTVAKEKRFYLKNKLTGDCLARCLSRASSGLYVEVTEKWLTRKEQTSYQLSFTQQEIDSMETGSYEQIEVEE